jgi:hypothetical protein
VNISSDQGAPLPLRSALSGHRIPTVYEMGWVALANGDLLRIAGTQDFAVLVTTDKNLRYQQNLAGRRIAVFVLPFASWPRLKSHSASIAQAINALAPGEFFEWTAP